MTPKLKILYKMTCHLASIVKVSSQSVGCVLRTYGCMQCAYTTKKRVAVILNKVSKPI